VETILNALHLKTKNIQNMIISHVFALNIFKVYLGISFIYTKLCDVETRRISPGLKKVIGSWWSKKIFKVSTLTLMEEMTKLNVKFTK
jgi:hypothetical protein